MRNTIGLLILIFVLSSCSSSPVKAPRQETPDAVYTSPSTDTGPAQIDSKAIQRALGMDRPATKLGFQQTAFDTCRIGYGYSKDKNCRQNYMVVIHYQLQCRDSEGTISEALTAADIQPVAERDVKWKLRNQSGVSRTNGEGHGEILAIFNESQFGQRLKLASGNEFLYLRANEINRIVAPRPWCSERSALYGDN